jgi:hypothetical protein
MNSPRFVSFLLKIVEIMKRMIISRKFSPAINDPIRVIQFLDDGNVFISA